MDTALVASHYEMEDNVIPASNSVMCENLYKLSIYFGNQHYETKCENMLAHIIPVIDYASAFSNWLNVFLNFSDEQRELAVCSPNAFLDVAEINSRYLPNLTIAGTSQPSKLPFLENRFTEGQNLYYVCQNKTCQLPESDLDAVLKNLESRH